MQWTGPWAKSYWAALALAVSALVPYLVLSSALAPLAPFIQSDLHMSAAGLALANGMANAGYALGTVLSIQFSEKLPGRRMLAVYSALFVVGSILAAAASSSAMYFTGHVLQGLSTSLMLIAAVPPTVAGFPASRLTTTNVVLGLGIFGAVAAGPMVGGLQAAAHGWRPLFWIVAGVGVLAFTVITLTFRDQPPTAPSARVDLAAITLAGVAAAAIFFGAAQLSSRPFASPVVLGPLLGGIVALIALLVYQFVATRGLLMVRELCTTIPVACTIIAVTAGAASVGVIELAQSSLAERHAPIEVGVLLLPELGGAVITSALIMVVLRTPWLMPFAVIGAALLTAGAGVLTGVATGSAVVALAGSGLAGLGIGASVAPALFIAGFVRYPKELSRVYALLELLRGAAAFAFAPIVLHVAGAASDPASGVRTGVWMCVGVAAAGVLLAIAVAVAGGLRMRAPDIDPWIAGSRFALESPPLGAALRR